VVSANAYVFYCTQCNTHYPNTTVQHTHMTIQHTMLHGILLTCPSFVGTVAPATIPVNKST
jgi:hypothetical protein